MPKKWAFKPNLALKDDMVRDALTELAGTGEGLPARLEAEMSSYLSRIERLEEFESMEKENQQHEAIEAG